MEKCPCGREARKDVYGKLEGQIVHFCSIDCAYDFLTKNVGVAIRIPED